MAARRQRHYLVFAGVNGAGKSTLYRSGIWRRAHLPKRMHRVNSDELLRKSGGDWASSKDQLAAMREAVRFIDGYLERGISFNQETTLAGKKSLRDIRRAKASGYTVTMFYVGVDDADIASKRIQGRVQIGGHGIEPADVKRRYHTSLANLNAAIELCDEVYLFDNTTLLTYACSFAHGVFCHYGSTRPDSWVAREVFDLT
jgi:predicted ABC-type ATPase